MNTKDNKQLVERYAQMWNTGESGIALEILAADYVDHAHPDLRGPEAIKTSVETNLPSMPGFHMEVDTMIAESDMVAFREKISMLVKGENVLLAEGMSMVRIRNGRMAERWTSYSYTARP
ncbi:ester cyclase [Microbispora sp. RL4-1S]|uniref:Ester cyclase n=1 Tax=Microbispora oryzae TaxID=2806554 RepID=A0A940WT94_9ACTN|nr:ester cyclase [Microbispora oryzae]MBP2706671.1 ester cyclase [Microbispora oryzae]